MKNWFWSILVVLFFTVSCSDDDQDTVIPTTPPDKLDLTQFDSGTEVMMQAFYWNVPTGGIWWDFIREEIEPWGNVGVDMVWLPQFAKSGSGGISMGYDPADFFDLGEYDQYGSVETRFGSKDELLALIDEIHSNDMKVIADIVLNHNGGGALEFNPFTGEEKYTLFTPEAGTNLSGRFNRSWEDFHPNPLYESDEEALFFPERDVCLQCPRVQQEMWLNEDSVAKYYANVLGIDGWRFDYVRGFNPNVITQWNDATGNLFSVGENFDGNAQNLRNWVDASGSSAFDFAMFYNMEKAFDSQRDLRRLRDDALFKIYPDKAVTFCGNHDTDDREEQGPTGFIDVNFKNLAYAFMLTHPGTPTLFYSDYEEKLDKTELNNLIAINKSIAAGELTVLYNDKDEYIARREGDDNNPGLIVYFNISSSPKSRNVITNWPNSKLYDYSMNTSYSSSDDLPMTNDAGLTEITVEPNSYTIWAPQTW